MISHWNNYINNALNNSMLHSLTCLKCHKRGARLWLSFLRYLSSQSRSQIAVALLLIDFIVVVSPHCHSLQHQIFKSRIESYERLWWPASSSWRTKTHKQGSTDWKRKAQPYRMSSLYMDPNWSLVTTPISSELSTRTILASQLSQQW